MVVQHGKLCGGELAPSVDIKGLVQGNKFLVSSYNTHINMGGQISKFSYSASAG